MLGCLLPIIPGIPFLIMGVTLLPPTSWVKKRVTALIHRMQKRKPE